MYEGRVSKLDELLERAGFDGLALIPGPNLFYLTGLRFHLMERPVVLLHRTRGRTALVLPELEVGKVGEESGLRLFTYGEDPASWAAVFRSALSLAGVDAPGARIAVESTHLRFLELSLLQDAAPVAEFLAGDVALDALRITKDDDEIQAIHQAVHIAERAFTELLASLKPGISEREVAADLMVQLLRAGSDPDVPFAPIVASGPNSANPHATPTDRRLAPGDLLVIDWGAAYQGYCSDLTRTVAIGEIKPELGRVYDLVEQANLIGRQHARVGMPAGEVDGAAREVIARGGYGDRFIHRLGHGFGLEEHEPPYLHGENAQPLQAGMTFTIEPGIYLPGRGGVRIEDDVLLTAGGPQVLSSLSRALTQIG